MGIIHCIPRIQTILDDVAFVGARMSLPYPADFTRSSFRSALRHSHHLIISLAPRVALARLVYNII